MRNYFLLPALFSLLSMWRLDSQTIFDQFYRPDSLLEVILQSDWDSLLDIRKTEIELKGKLSFRDMSGQITEWKVDISARGRFRRRVCSFPPIKLDFSKKELNNKQLLPFDNMKLVTHCLDDSLSSDRIVREYLLYRMYQLLAPQAFRVQLVKVNYVDIDRSKPSQQQFGILMENNQILGARLGLERIDTLGLSTSDFPGDMADVHALFQYLIANSDWGLANSKNLQMLHGGDPRRFYLVPYDFDFSGFVKAPYAIPDPNYRLTNIRQRVYLGGSPPSDSARASLLAQRAAFILLIRKSPYLSAASKADCIAFLKSGFLEIKKNRLAMPQ